MNYILKNCSLNLKLSQNVSLGNALLLTESVLNWGHIYLWCTKQKSLLLMFTMGLLIKPIGFLQIHP